MVTERSVPAGDTESRRNDIHLIPPTPFRYENGICMGILWYLRFGVNNNPPPPRPPS